MRAIGDMSIAHVAHQNTIRAVEWDLKLMAVFERPNVERATVNRYKVLGKRLK
jgi:hypothetical protein